MGKGNAVNFPLIIFESFVAHITFGPHHVDLMGQIDGALGVAHDTGGLGPFMAGKTAFHARPVGLGGHLVMHDIVVAKGALSPGLLHMELMGNDDLQRVMLERLDILLLHVSMAAQAVGIRPFGVWLLIAGDPLLMAGMALRATDPGMAQRFLQERHLILPVMAGEAELRPGGGKVGQAQKEDNPQNDHSQSNHGQHPVGQVNNPVKNSDDEIDGSSQHTSYTVLSTLKLW